MRVKVVIFNESSVLTDKQIEAVIPALQKQVSRDFAPVWGRDCHLVFVPKGKTVPAGAWSLGIFDDADQAGALGYHEESDKGIPMGKVFAKTDLQYGSSWSVTISHELLEMLADPWVYFTASGVDENNNEQEYALEVCDAVEDDSLGYSINGVLVSNFQTPHWFDMARAGKKVAFDFCGRCEEPFQILAGGYMAVRPPGGSWIQINAQRMMSRRGSAAPLGSRRERRYGKLLDFFPTELKSRVDVVRSVVHEVLVDAHAFTTAIQALGVVPPDVEPGTTPPDEVKASSGVTSTLSMDVKKPDA